MRGNVNQHIRNTHSGLPIDVIDHNLQQRTFVKAYDYSGIGGSGVEEVHDASKMVTDTAVSS